MNDCAAHRSASQSGAVGCAKTPLARGNTRTAETRMYLIKRRPPFRRDFYAPARDAVKNKVETGRRCTYAQAPKRGSMGIRERGEPQQRLSAGGLLPITPCAARTARRLRAP